MDTDREVPEQKFESDADWDRHVEALLLEGVTSLEAGRGIELTPEYMENQRRDLENRIRARSGPQSDRS